MSNRKRPENMSFEKLVDALASGTATWERFEEEVSAAAGLTPGEKLDIRTAAQCRLLEWLNRNPISEAKLEKIFSAFPPVTEATRRFIDKGFRDELLEGAILEGLRARGKCASASDNAPDITALYLTCNPRDGADSALARLLPMLLHATTGCFERAEDSESLEVRHVELTHAFKGAHALVQLADSLHKDRPERSRKKK